MKSASPVLQALARRYERSKAGRKGKASRDLLIPLEDLLADAGSIEGEKRALAEQQLAQAELDGIIERVPFHKRDRSRIFQIRFNPENENSLYAAIAENAPTLLREKLASQFSNAARLEVPDKWRVKWESWCAALSRAAAAGDSISPLDRAPSPENDEILSLLPKLLAWQGESLLRFASCVLCNDSKRLEQLRPKLERLLQQITAGEINSFEDIGIVANPRSVLLHGPLKLIFQNAELDLGLLSGPVRLSHLDIQRAFRIETSARRCLTIENETTFHELAKLQSGELLLCTSFPGSATVELLHRLPASIQFWHFGDSDEAGFEILRVLRQKSGRDFQPLHMQVGKIPFEQESMGRPTSKNWPFYEE